MATECERDALLFALFTVSLIGRLVGSCHDRRETDGSRTLMAGLAGDYALFPRFAATDWEHLDTHNALIPVFPLWAYQRDRGCDAGNDQPGDHRVEEHRSCHHGWPSSPRHPPSSTEGPLT